MASTIARVPRTPGAAKQQLPSSNGGGPVVAALLAWAAIIGIAVLWGLLIRPAGHPGLTRPLVGTFDLRVTAWALPALALAVLAVVAAPRLSGAISWRALLWGTFALAVVWAVSLALADGPAAITRPLLAGQEYLAAVPLVDDPLEFLRTFTDRIARYPVHVEGHPPGTLILLTALDRAGLGGAGAAAALAVGLGASAAPAVLVAARELAGEDVARRAAPFLALAPYAVWVATSMDGVYLGIGGWAVAMLVVATGRPGARALGPAALGGALFGAGLLFSYGLAPLALVPLAVAMRRRRPDVVAWAGIGVVVPICAAALGGFWWPDGLAATRERYAAGVARLRPFAYFVVANIAALAIALGPAAAAALARLRDRGLWAVAGGALAAVAIADLSGLSKGEVERIWLPLMPWLLASSAALDGGRHRGWLAAQVAAGLTVQLAWRSLW